jgi:hypothetical protein
MSYEKADNLTRISYTSITSSHHCILLWTSGQINVYGQTKIWDIAKPLQTGN